MPRIGRSDSNTSRGATGAPWRVVDSGPPDRMMPLAPNAAISPGSWSQAQISQYTPSSRMRRAINWVYCAPKSRMRILSVWMGCCMGIGNWEWGIVKSRSTALDVSLECGSLHGCGLLLFPFPILYSPFPTTNSIEPVVRRFLGDLDVMRMRLVQPGAGNAHELRLLAHAFDVAATAVAHGRAQAAHHLVHDVAQRPAIRHAALDAFGHQLVGVGVVLEVAVLGAALHGAQRTHAAVALVRASLEQLDLARRFLGTGKHGAEHDHGSAGGNRLGHVAGVTDAAIGDQRNVVLERLGDHVDGGDLRHAHAGDQDRKSTRLNSSHVAI